MDQLEVEKLGIPTVTIASSEFVSLARDTALSRGAADVAFVIVPHPLGMIPLEEIRAKAEAAFPEILEKATNWVPSGELTVGGSAYPAERITFEGTLEEVNDLFYRNGWSLGLPIIPPTVDRVEQMLQGTSRSPDEVVAVVPPRGGTLTVELVATHAVMAGCEPEYMPVLIAAMEALMDPAHGWQASTTTTNPVAPVIIVNGPIVEELGIQYSTGALGGGPAMKPNVSLGHAINLVGDVVGGSKPPSPDKSTLGQSANIIAMVFAENEEANPWDTLQVDMGFDADTSTVMAFAARSFVNNNLHDCAKAEDILSAIAEGMKGAGGVAETIKPCSPDNMELLVLGPEHAAQIAQEGWTKEQVQEFLFEKVQIPAEIFAGRYTANPEKMGGHISCIEGWDEMDAIPLVVEPDDIMIVVAGGPGKHSVYMSTNGYSPVIKEVKP